MKPNELNQRVGVARKETAVLDENGNPVRRYLIEPRSPIRPRPPARLCHRSARSTTSRKSPTWSALMSGQSARTLR